MADPLQPLREAMADPARLGEWRRCTFHRRRVLAGEDWERLVATPVALKRGPAVKLEAAHEGKRRTWVVAAEDWPRTADGLLAERFDNASLLADAGDVHARRTRKGGWKVGRGAPSQAAPAAVAHDRERAYPLPPDDPRVAAFLRATGLTGASGKVLAASAGKYRQVQHYLELLRPLPVWDEAAQAGRPLRILDAACGKAVMSLALVLYGELRGAEVELVGVDRQESLVEGVRALADELGYRTAHFEAATVEEYAARPGAGPVDLLISLHACDTATDEAIAAGVALGARAIVLAPCCHRELAGQIGEPPAGWEAAVRHGLLRSRLADLVTDALRAAALEVVGYRAEAIEFVAAEHTARNLMLRAVRRERGALPGVLDAYLALERMWGVEPSARRLLEAAGAWPQAGAPRVVAR